MRATEDRLCRSATLWQQGWFDRLPAELEHGVVGCAQDGLGWAILMTDFKEVVTPYTQITILDNEQALEAMAALHVTFFETPSLTDPELGLCRLRHIKKRLEMT